MLATRNSQPATAFHTAARIVLVTMLMAVPLAFGAVQPWAWGAMTALVACVLLLWALGCACIGIVEVIWSPLYLPALALLGLVLVQLHFGLTLDPIGTREAMLKLVTYLAIFFLTQQLFAGWPERVLRMTAVTVALYAFAMALFAIIEFFAAPGVLYGVIKLRWGGYVFGPYVNHNHYAGLMEMLIPITAVFNISMRRKHPAKPFLGFVVFICLSSVFLSGSRGGLFALAVEFAVFTAAVLCAGLRKQDTGNLETQCAERGPENGKRETAKILIVACCLLLGAGLFFSWLDPGDILKRWELEAHQPELAGATRLKIAIDSFHMLREHLVRGVGVGAFEVAYPRYQTVATDQLIDYAHNDYAQFLAESGLMGWIIGAASLAMFAVALFQRLRDHFRDYAGWLQLAAAVGVCGILVHSFFDFNLHIPANAAWFFACGGMALASRRDPPVA